MQKRMNQENGHAAPLSNYGEFRGESFYVSVNKGASKISFAELAWSNKNIPTANRACQLSRNISEMIEMIASFYFSSPKRKVIFNFEDFELIAFYFRTLKRRQKDKSKLFWPFMCTIEITFWVFFLMK